MSIILKGIDLDEITKGNGYARLIIEEDGAVVDDCTDIIIGQAIQIPKEHGRISDVGRIRKELNEMLVEGETFVNAVEFAKLTIDAAPTILEAEE